MKLGYDAVKQDRSRRIIYYSTKSEDRELLPRQRQSIVSQSRDALRNFTLAGFVLRKHLQSIAWYQFKARTGIEWFDRELTRRINQWKRREHCDASGRYSFDSLLYMVELLRACDGDVGIHLLRNNKIQVIEGDRIRNFPDTGKSEFGDSGDSWVHGIKINPFGRPIAYAVSRRLDYGFEHERIISASNFRLLGYYTRLDQLRGVSLMAPALRAICYLNDSLDLAMAKMKLEQVLGLKTMIDDNYGIGYKSEEPSREDVAHKNALESLGTGILHLQLRPGEDAAFMESSNPSANFQSFVENILRLIFSSFDIPYSFYDGSKTNFYGSEGEFEQYIDSVERKQAPTIEMLNEITIDWLIPNWMTDSDHPLILPNGLELNQLYGRIGWSGAGLPSWRMFRRVKEMMLAVQAGFLPISEAVGDYGYDVLENLQDMKKVSDQAAKLGLSLPFGKTEQSINVGV